MNKVLKKVGLSAVVATFVFGLASTSSALMAQAPDNETALFSTTTDVLVEASSDATYSETEDYSLVLDNTTGKAKGTTFDKTGLTYTKDYKATNGEAHVVSTFDATEEATTTKPNIKTSNKVTFNTNYEGLNAGTFTGTEKIAYQRCQPSVPGQIVAFCGATGTNSVSRAHGDLAMGQTFNVKYAGITTSSDVTAVARTTSGDNQTILPSMNMVVDATGLGIYGQDDTAIGSVQTGMKASVKEYGGMDNVTTNLSYERHTKASGYIKYHKDMSYRSKVKNTSVSGANINSVP